MNPTASTTADGTTNATADATRTEHVAPARTPGVLAAISSEWIKTSTLRSTWVTLGASALVLVLIGTLAAAASADGQSIGPPGAGESTPLGTVLTGANFAMLILGVLGCLAGAREYTSRMITTTFIATPRRGRIVAAKAVTLVAVVVPVAAIGVLGAFVAGTAVLEGRDMPSVSLDDPGVAGDLVGMVFWLACVALMGLALGLLLRSTAASIGSLLALVLVLPPIVGALLPDSADGALQALPSNAASAFTALTSSGEVTLGATAGVLVVLTWVVGLLGAAVRSVLVRDA